MGIVTEYLKYQEEYQERYGERTVVLMEVGSFMEIYEFDPNKNETDEIPAWPTKKLGHATYLSSLLGYTLTKRNKNKPYSLENPNMIGFPCVSYDKHKDILLSKDYTIVVVEQEQAGKNSIRKVTQVLSPATEINDLNPIPISNQIVSIYIDVQKEAVKYEDYLITVGISTIDVTTGNNVVGEMYSKEKDAVHALQEIYRFLSFTQPRELIININGIKKNNERSEGYKDYVIMTLEVNKYPIYIIKVNNIDPEYLKSNYHQQFLSKVFNNDNKAKLKIVGDTNIVIKENKNILEELGLERLHYGTISYILLLQYCYEHNERLIEKLKNPDTHWLDESEHLVITHNALGQLDIPSKITGKDNSLFSVIDNTSTALGRRFLLNMLCNPITNSTDINEYYIMIDDLLENRTLLNEIEDNLKKIPDMERYQRKLQLKLIKPNEFVTLFRGYLQIVTLYTMILNTNTSIKKLLFNQVNDFNKCLTTVLSKYDLEQLNTAKIENDVIVCDNSIFYSGTDPTADNYGQAIKQHNDKLNSIIDHLNSHLSSTRGKLIDYNDSKNKKEKTLGLFTTIHKGSVLNSSPINTDLCGKLQVVPVNKEAMITSDVIAGLCQNILNLQEQHSQYLYRCYNKTINDISNYDFFNSINLFVGKLDYVKSNAKTAIKNKYHRPEILDVNTDVSNLDIKELRHPIAEKIIDNIYVTNDLTLGLKPYGILLYGANSAGKSTLAKAVGLNLIMAQAGMYTACKMKYVPYNKIITRLSGEDNLIQGKSSFVVEMTELRTILRNADSKTLILGDELCRGTESISGTALTISTIIDLVERKSSFIFSTHMHHLVSNPYIMELPQNTLRICHLVLRYDESTKSLIYDRKLKEGPGESIYGLEVAMSLSIDPNFINKAAEIRRSLVGNKDIKILSTKKSKYNKKVYMDSCSICGKKPNGTELHTHHINEQANADIDGYIEHYHKDSSFNLITLCDSCHKALHANGLEIITQQTLTGKIIKIPIK